MPRKKVVMTIPKDMVSEPVVYQLVKDYSLVVNVLRAQLMSDEEGKIVLELDGAKDDLERGLAYLRQKGIHLDLLNREMRIDESKCVDCGACTAVCTQKALSMDKTTWKLSFDRSRCVLCGYCVDACPVRAIKVTF